MFNWFSGPNKRHLQIILGFSCVCSIATAAELSHSQNQLADLTRYFPSDEVKTVQAGEQSIPVMISEQNGPHPKGSAILLPDIGLQASQSFADLRLLLNDYGWITIGSIAPDNGAGVWQLDDEQAKVLTGQPTLGAEQIKVADSAAIKDQLKLIVNALNTEAQNYIGLRLLVAQGATAGWLIESLTAGDIPMPDALVLLSPYLPEYYLNKKLPAKIAKLDLPILDVWSKHDNRWALATVKNRQQAARKYLTMHYRQRQLFGLSGLSVRENRLAKEIYAYMTYLGW
ncbi:DUF3530 family protein [Catenovulum adriaticum]|uniref:Alpha/beta hydrolase family protein n=1 Tax=Catenovulum adriaticum TaxID=2984846 RepID=A0ABY7AMI7_9ALTE|nr:DUF3530 family protein [Catenovulum sp. TS8]WAJ70777.1 alpha/beta hydrolase family protein [Catenovulum sp. TS8]